MSAEIQSRSHGRNVARWTGQTNYRSDRSTKSVIVIDLQFPSKLSSTRIVTLHNLNKIKQKHNYTHPPTYPPYFEFRVYVNDLRSFQSTVKCSSVCIRKLFCKNLFFQRLTVILFGITSYYVCTQEYCTDPVYSEMLLCLHTKIILWEFILSTKNHNTIWNYFILCLYSRVLHRSCLQWIALMFAYRDYFMRIYSFKEKPLYDLELFHIISVVIGDC